VVFGSAYGSILGTETPNAVPGSYIVVLRPGRPATTADLGAASAAAELTGRHGGTVRFTYQAALRGFAVQTSEQAARRMAADPRVAYVAQDQTVTADVFVQPNPPAWGLDRIDERSRPVDAKYHYPSGANSVRAYIIDTGIRFTHQEFGGRAVPGVDTVGDGRNGNDCNGHGTAVAGVVGGATVGVAKAVTLVSVRVLGCSGSGSTAQVIAGIDWITAQQTPNGHRAVANLSLGGPANQALDAAVTASINANVHYSVSAGGSASNACNFSPARVARATTVGATDAHDNRASFSSIGPCLDLFAPGTATYTAWHTSDAGYSTLSGTSFSTPLAAGTAALWRHRFPADTADGVAAALANNATPGVVGNPGTGSPNRLLFMGMVPM
jgi:subtilisin family serine protease